MSRADIPCLFIFNGKAQGVREPALSTFTAALLAAVSRADPNGAIATELRGGLPLLSDFAQKVSEVSASERRSSHTISHDMSLYRMLLWDMSEALGNKQYGPNPMEILDVLRFRQEECLALSHVSSSVRIKCDEMLRQQPGYIGSCEIDVGNPILRRAFFDGLMHLAYIENGTVIQQRSIEGFEEFELEGAVDFEPGGLRWVDYSFAQVPARLKLAEVEVSPRGRLFLDRFERRTHVTVEGRVFQKLAQSSWSTKDGKEFRFSSAEPGHDVLQAIMPEGKFTDFLFNFDHEKGRSRATFFVDELGFAPEDWRFLAAQFYDGLLLSEPRDLEIQEWDGGYGARFNSLVNVTSRTGKQGVVRTGWMLRPDELPSLSTAVPDRSSPGIVTPVAPPVIFPEADSDAKWSRLFVLADERARVAHAATLPTPMILKDFGVIEDGECGSASILVEDGRRSFPRWLLRTGRGDRGYRGGVEIPCLLPSQSAERAEAYASAFARVLALNGIPARIEARRT